MAADEDPRYNNKVDIWSMGCILYELATGTCAFKSDWAVLEYRFSGTNKDVILDETFDADSKETITKHIVNMLQIESSSRPPASVLSEEFIRQCQLQQVNDHITGHLNSAFESVTLVAVPDETEMPSPPQQKNQVVAPETENYLPGRPSRLTRVPLYRVAKDGNVDAVKMFLNENADVNKQGGKYGNPLQAASKNGHEVIVQLLLENGGDVNADGGFYGNALQAAARNGHEAVVQLLLEKGADVNAHGGYNGTALIAGANSGNEEVVLLLLEKGADVKDTVEGKDSSALHAGSRQGHEGVVRLLLEKGADVNAEGGVYGNALQAASRHGNERLIRLLLERGADVNAQGGAYGNALLAASDKGHKVAVQLLLENGARFQGGTES
jgi:ankyrin repeat protein